MRILNNSKRIINFFIHRRNEIFTPEFLNTLKRVFRDRFFYFHKVSKGEFADNLRQIETRPWNLHIELTNICNADCVFCAYHLERRKKIIMTNGIYLKALGDYAAIGGGELRLETCLGDPLLDPDFVDRIRLARSYKEITKITTLTNGINLDHIDLDAFITSGINEVGISSGPWDEQLYKSIYRTNDYQRMRNSVTALLKKNVELGGAVNIRILFRSSLPMHKTLELPDYRAIKDLPHKVEFNTDYDTWIGGIKNEDLPKGMHLRPMATLEKEPCYWLYDGPMVFSDGSLGLCGCRDFNADSELILGNIMQASLLELWHSEKARNLRHRFWRGDFPDLCSRCTAYANLDLYRSAEGKIRADFIKKVSKND